jgi:arylsulfatase A-like enzyme
MVGLLVSALAPVLWAQPADFKGRIGFDLKDSVEAWPEEVSAPPGAPNIIIILLDDVGFGASHVFGGPVAMPELERVSNAGLKYNNFRTTAICSASRAALLSGRNDHRMGFGTISETAFGFPGYNGIWGKDVVSLPEVLRRNGYSTAAFGKWHNTPLWEVTPAGPFDRWPTGLGFDYFYGFQGGDTSQWYPALYRNTLAVAPPKAPSEGYHLTTDLADDAIRWLHTHESHAPDKPYLLYFAPGAAHEPLQAPRAWIEKYRGRFDQGYDQLRQEIFHRQKKLGVIPENTELTPRPPEWAAWDSYSPDERRLMARQMEVYAGFLAHADHEIGRVVRAAQEGPHGNNTLIFYIVGDNGASAEGGRTGHEGFGPRTVEQRLAVLDEMGGVVRRGSTRYANGWAYALNSPFKWGKRVASHYGGTTAPMVVSWPAKIRDRGGLRTQFSHLNDIAPTIYEAAGITFPAVVDGVKQLPLDGTSLLYSFDEPLACSTHRLQIFEQLGNRAIYQDGWIAAARHGFPWDSPRDKGGDYQANVWELYHVAEDFSQAHDLSARYPEKLRQLQERFEQEARVNHIYPLIPMKATTHAMPNVGRGEFVFYPEVEDLPRPDFLRPYRVTAEVVIPPAGARGVIAESQRGDGSGFVLYVSDDRLVFECAPVGPLVTRLVSQEPLPRGRVVLAVEFTPASETTGAAGISRLYLNDRLVGESSLEAFAKPGIPRHATFCVGAGSPAPTAPSLSRSEAFTGQITRVCVRLK